MAELFGEEGDFDQQIDQAGRAAQQYESYGSVDGAADAALLMVNGEANRGDLDKSLRDAQQLLDKSERTYSDLFIEDTEAEIGVIYSALEREPEALHHFQRSLELSHQTGSQIALKLLHVAGSLARLGHTYEAARLLVRCRQLRKTILTREQNTFSRTRALAWPKEGMPPP